MSAPSDARPAAAAAPGPGALMQCLRPLRGTMVAIGLFRFVLSALLLTPSIYMLQVYDRVLASRSEATLLMLTLLVAFLYGLLAFVERVRAEVLLRVSHWIDARLADRVFAAAFDESARTRGGNPSMAMNDLTTLRQFIAGNGLILVFDVPFTLVFLLAAFVIDVWMGWFIVFACVVLLSLAWWTERRTHAPLLEANQLAQRAAGTMNNSFRNAEVIRGMQMLGAVRRRWQAHALQAQTLQAEASAAAARIGAVTKFFRLFFQSLALGLGALLVLEGRITAGMMIAASILLGRALAPIELLIGTWRQVIAARDAQGRLDRLLAEAPAEDGPRLALPAPTGALRLEQAAVTAPGGREPLVQGLSFSLAPGQALGLIGPSGAGKSCVLRLLGGVWPPSAGHVRLDGADLAQWPAEQLAGAMGYLPQDVELFEGTVAENIARLQEPDDAAVVAAAQSAGVHELVLRMPQGYATPIGPGGASLSGGQRQRVGLARALYGQPVLLLLDEPNANLDDAGDAALQRALDAAKARGCTVVVATHKLSLLRVCDQLMLLRDGQVALHGPRDQVLAELQGPRPAAVTAAPVRALGGGSATH